MSDKSTSGDSSNDERANEAEPIKAVSKEEGFKSAEDGFKVGGNKSEDGSSDEYREFHKYLKHRKMAKDLGLEEPSSVTYQGGIHIRDSNVENHGDIVGNDKTTYSNINTGGFSGESRQDSSNTKESIQSIESVFDRSEDIKQRCFMISLAVLNGCNYRAVVEASQRLQSILEPPVEVESKT